MANAGTPASNAALEILAAQAYIDFATELTSGALNPDDFSNLINFDTVRPTLDTLMAKMVASTGSGALYDRLEPQDISYTALQAKLARLEALVQAGGWGPKTSSGRAKRLGGPRYWPGNQDQSRDAGGDLPDISNCFPR